MIVRRAVAALAFLLCFSAPASWAADGLKVGHLGLFYRMGVSIPGTFVVANYGFFGTLLDQAFDLDFRVSPSLTLSTPSIEGEVVGNVFCGAVSLFCNTSITRETLSMETAYAVLLRASFQPWDWGDQTRSGLTLALATGFGQKLGTVARDTTPPVSENFRTGLQWVSELKILYGWTSRQTGSSISFGPTLRIGLGGFATYRLDLLQLQMKGFIGGF